MKRKKVLSSHFLLLAKIFFILIPLLSLCQSLLESGPTFGSQPVLEQKRPTTSPPPPGDIKLDSRLPVQTVSAHTKFTNMNAKFGSRLNFSVSPGSSSVRSGSAGVFYDNVASYLVGITPRGQKQNFIFHMGSRKAGDTYVSNESWIQGLNTTRWFGDVNLAPKSERIRVYVDIIDSFLGQPGCTDIANCLSSVKDDIVPAFIIGISLQNFSSKHQEGLFQFGSNRPLAAENACTQHTTPDGTRTSSISYSPDSDVTGGTLFLAGAQAQWRCNTAAPDRAGLAWNYRVAPRQTTTAYMLLGAWNANQKLFINTMLPENCQNEGLYATRIWPSHLDVINFALDNLHRRDNLLQRAQTMENILIANTTLNPKQRWLIGNTLRSYKATSWLTARPACAGGGYDATVYEGTYGFLSTVDVMHEYSYFEIERVPWFFKAALSTVFKNAVRNKFGTYFQHDQGGNIDKYGNCTTPGRGVPTLRTTCYAPPYVADGVPMPTEENTNVALLLAYYIAKTNDTAFLHKHIHLIDSAMFHNINVGDPKTGIAIYDTNTTYDAADDCLHNDADGAGNLYYQGLKEVAGYRAAAYLDDLIPGNTNAPLWRAAATKIEQTMLDTHRRNGFIPLADNDSFSNCSGRSITLGEGLFYLHLIGQINTVNPELLKALAGQYLADLKAVTISKPPYIVLVSENAEGYQCDYGRCRRYAWFSKIMLSALVADFVYTRYGCSTQCSRLDLVWGAYTHNINAGLSFADGQREDQSDWDGHVYPRGLISWAFLNSSY